MSRNQFLSFWNFLGLRGDDSDFPLIVHPKHASETRVHHRLDSSTYVSGLAAAAVRRLKLLTTHRSVGVSHRPHLKSS